MSKNFGPKIVCPYCGQNYLPGEIYIPDCFVGRPTYVEKDCYGKILYTDSHKSEMDLKETYTCDKCNKTFKVSAVVQFRTEKKEELNAKQPFAIKLKPKLILNEQ